MQELNKQIAKSSPNAGLIGKEGPKIAESSPNVELIQALETEIALIRTGKSLQLKGY